MITRIFTLVAFFMFTFSLKAIAQNEGTPQGTSLPFLIQPESNKQLMEMESLFKEIFHMKEEDEYRMLKKETDQIGILHEVYQQYYKGIKIEGAIYKVHIKDGQTQLLSGHYFDIFTDLDINPKIGEFQALANAYQHAKVQTSANWYDIPKAELVILADPQGKELPHLAYKFNIYSMDPLYRAYVFIDAQNGEFLTEHPIIHTHDVNAGGQSLYNGPVNFTADFTGNQYRLRQSRLGGGVETYDLNNGSSYSRATDITSSSPNFTSDRTGVQAHWGAEQTYLYFKEYFNRNSYDNAGSPIKSYVHFGRNYVNAFWDGSRMTYGDGNGSSYGPLVSLDIVGHELTHGVTQHSADLIYRNESGALNESFSDIFGETVEEFASGSNDWLIGHDIGIGQSGAFRSLRNPKAFRDPDTYKGRYWFTGDGDNGGVHTNSGVQNKWFYILSEGETGTNDLGNSYNVPGIGISNAARIAYRNLTVYLSPTSNYADARVGAIQAAVDLFGKGSVEEIITTNAWYAVGVGDEYSQSNYCSSSGQNASREWIAEVSVGDFKNTSGAAGYSDFTGQTIELYQDEFYPIGLKPGYSGTSLPEYWKVWIDFNIDGDFDDDGELIFSSDVLRRGELTGRIFIPERTTGRTRMRVSMKYNAEQSSSCENFSFGEVEDYTVFLRTKTDTERPSPPSNLKASNIQETSFRIDWDPSTDDSEVVLYNIYLNESIYGSTNTLNFTLTGLKPATRYYVSVTALDEAQNESFPIGIFVKTLGDGDIEPPTPPTNLFAFNTTQNSTDLFWSASTDNVGVAAYQVYIDGNPYAKTTARVLKVINLQPSTDYVFSVTALDEAGNESSRKSISVTTLPEEDTEPPSRPRNLRATNTTTNSTVLRWSASTDNRGIKSYSVYQGRTHIGTTPSTQFEVKGLLPGNNYTLRVRAEDLAGNKSDFSTIRVRTLEEEDTQAPSSPLNLMASNTTFSSTQLSWSRANDNVGVSKYNIYNGQFLLGSTTGLNYDVTGLAPSTSYVFYVTALDAAGNESVPAGVTVVTADIDETDTENQPLVIASHFFETDWDNWTDGGDDCYRYQGPFSWEGNYSIRIRDNAGIASSMTSPVYNLKNKSFVKFEFSFYARSMEQGEDFMVQYFDGNNWQTIASFASGVDFINNNYYGVSIPIDGATLNLHSRSQFRIMCDASADSDQIYIDAVILTSLGNNQNLQEGTIRLLDVNATETLKSTSLTGDITDRSTDESISVFPNPVNDYLYMNLAQQAEKVSIINQQGQLIKSWESVGDGIQRLDLTELNVGWYVLQILTKETVINQKIIKR